LSNIQNLNNILH